MKITYISHSGFAVELPSATLLFDYYKGQLPAFPTDKPLFVFASHSHGDHFVPQVFDLATQHPDVRYIFSHDIWMMRKKHTRAGVPEKHFEIATYMRAHETRTFFLTATEMDSHTPSSNSSSTHDFTSDTNPSLTVATLRSTDMGVAFLIECDGLRIYHAGDLHWWAWPQDTKQAANNMTANYQREIASLRDMLITCRGSNYLSTDDSSVDSDSSAMIPPLDIAFLPLDGRLEENYAMGMNYFLQKIPVKNVFPMHFWDNYEVITSYLQKRYQHEFSTQTIYLITQEYQSWEL